MYPDTHCTDIENAVATAPSAIENVIQNILNALFDVFKNQLINYT